jgi:methylmalonyl-CoA mutase cobalamin-binding subunit
LKAQHGKYRRAGRVRTGSPKIPGKNVLIFCTYSGPHTGLNEAIPAGKYAGQFFEHLGFTVVDLGVDVSAEAFAQAVRDHRPQVLGMSSLLTTTMIGMQDVVEELERQGLRDKVKVIIGGSPVSKRYAEQIGADGYGNDAAQAVYPMTKTLADGTELDGSKHKYTLTFAKAEYPPVNAFWSVSLS